MRASASRRRPVRLRPLDVPDAWPAAAVVVAVDHDAVVAGMEGVIRALVRRAVAVAPMHSTVSIAVTSGRVEVRDEGSVAIHGFDGELARGLARRAGADVHVFEGLAVLELPSTDA